jgi:hypothetical protein
MPVGNLNKVTSFEKDTKEVVRDPTVEHLNSDTGECGDTQVSHRDYLQLFLTDLGRTHTIVVQEPDHVVPAAYLQTAVMNIVI